MREKVLKAMLDNEDDFISGEELSKQIGISRTAIWKHINALKENGYNIESVNKKGYRLVEKPDDILMPENVYYNLDTKFIGKNIVHLDTVDSTNNYAKSIANDVADGTVVISEEQTSGKGRLGRVWKSKSGDGIWMSIIVKPDISPTGAPFLTLIAGASIVKGLQNLGVDASIKWPNDVIINRKKICGILTELSAEIERINYVVVGIGINVKTLEFPKDIEDKGTSLFKEGFKLSRLDIVKEIFKEFEKLYNSYILDRNVQDTIKICKEHSLLINQDVYLIKDDGRELVRCIDINENGNLVVKDRDNNIKEIFSGEVSVRGINGYV